MYHTWYSTRVYLDGPMFGLTNYGASHWRSQAKIWLLQNKIFAYNPMNAIHIKGKNIILSEKTLSEKILREYVEREKRMMESCDVVVFNFGIDVYEANVPYDLLVRYGWAKDKVKVVITGIDKWLNFIIRYSDGIMFQTLDDALFWIIEDDKKRRSDIHKEAYKKRIAALELHRESEEIRKIGEE